MKIKNNSNNIFEQSNNDFINSYNSQYLPNNNSQNILVYSMEGYGANKGIEPYLVKKYSKELLKIKSLQDKKCFESCNSNGSDKNIMMKKLLQLFKK